MTTETDQHASPPIQELERVTIRFAGDSGDGMQLTGSQFTRTAAVFGNDIATLPDFPAEIRAPAGSLAGVSGFQISFSSTEIHTPGDSPDVLVAMNPAALRANLRGRARRAAPSSSTRTPSTRRTWPRPATTENPLEDGSLSDYNVFEIPIGTLNARALEGLDMTAKQVDLTKNFFALGRHVLALRALHGAHHRRGSSRSSRRRPVIVEANLRALKAGYAFGETTEIFHTQLPRPARHACHPARTATSPATRPRRSASWPPQAGRPRPLLRLLPHHARPATSSTSSPPTSTSACAPSRRRTRSRPSARPSAPPSAGPSG